MNLVKNEGWERREWRRRECVRVFVCVLLCACFFFLSAVCACVERLSAECVCVVMGFGHS